MSFFSYKVKGCAKNPYLHYEVGHFAEEEWHPHVISGPLFKTFEEADSEALAMAERVENIYRRVWMRKLAQQAAKEG